MANSIINNVQVDKKIAVLLATYNRKSYTLSCLESIYHQQLPDCVSLEIFITDDASKDGTADAVKNIYPDIHVISGSGSLFWAGGMRSSWNAALNKGADYYLLLNDDTLLDSLAVKKLLDYYQLNSQPQPAICIGSTQDKEDESISYGGHKLYNTRKPQFYPIHNDTAYLDCDMANANIMLVPGPVVEKIGILSDRYTHSIADFDYILRAKSAGYRAVVVPGVLGYCTDDHGKNWKSAGTKLRDRIAYLKSPKGLAYTEYLWFIKTHFPLYLPAAFIKLWMKTLFPVVWDKFK